MVGVVGVVGLEGVRVGVILCVGVSDVLCMEYVLGMCW